MANATRFVEVNWKPNRERLYGAVECISGVWSYQGDTDQCGDCGCDRFTVNAVGQLLCMQCDECGTTYGLLED